MANRIQLRRGTAAEWAAKNPILAPGEPGVESDTGQEKFGDGVTRWNDRPYAKPGPEGKPGLNGSNVLPTDAAIRQAIEDPESETSTALSATIASTTGAEILEYFDDFERPNGPVGAALSGQIYETTGGGQPTIVDGKLVSALQGTAYIGFELSGPVSRMGIDFDLLTTGGATQAVAIVFGPGPAITDLHKESVHLIVTRTEWAIQTRESATNPAGIAVTYKSGIFATPLVQGVTYRWEVEATSDGSIVMQLPDGTVGAWNSPQLAARMGTSFFIEPTKGAPGADETRILAAWGYARVNSATQEGQTSIPDKSTNRLARLLSSFLASTPILPGDDLVARKGFTQQVRIGRALSANVAGIVFNELIDLFIVGNSLRTKAGTFYINDGHATDQVSFGGMAGGPGMSARDTNTRLTSPFTRVWATAADNGFRTGKFASTARPNAGAFGEGTMIYDTDLKKPLWSSGADGKWRDAAGVAVN